MKLLKLVPDQLGRYFGPIIALSSGPLTFVMSNDAYYFGVIPVVGLPSVVAAAPSLAMALGYDVSDDLEQRSGG